MWHFIKFLLERIQQEGRVISEAPIAFSAAAAIVAAIAYLVARWRYQKVIDAERSSSSVLRERLKLKEDQLAECRAKQKEEPPTSEKPETATRWVRVDEAIYHAAGFSDRGEPHGEPLKAAIKNGFRDAALNGKMRVRGQIVLGERQSSGVFVDIPSRYWETHELDNNAFAVVSSQPITVGIIYPQTRHIAGRADADRYSDLCTPLSDLLSLWPLKKKGGPFDAIHGEVRHG